LAEKIINFIASIEIGIVDRADIFLITSFDLRLLEEYWISISVRFSTLQ